MHSLSEVQYIYYCGIHLSQYIKINVQVVIAGTIETAVNEQMERDKNSS